MFKVVLQHSSLSGSGSTTSRCTNICANNPQIAVHIYIILSIASARNLIIPWIYNSGEPMTEVAIGKVTDMISFNIDGPNISNIKIKGNQWFDPFPQGVQCICECYCGSTFFDEQEYINEFIRFIDQETLNRAHNLSVCGFLNRMRTKFPIEKYPGLRDPKSYAKYSVFNKSSVRNDMLHFQTYPIKRSLTILILQYCKDEDELEYCKKEAIQIFKMICCVQGNCAYRARRDVPFEIIQRGLDHAVLRDEIYMQLIKQTRGNPDELSIEIIC